MKKIIKICVSLVLITGLAWRLDWSAFWNSAERLHWWVIPVAIFLQLCAFVLGTCRWQSFFRFHDVPYTTSLLLKPYFIGTLFNNLLPMATGGDVLRIYYIIKEGQSVAIAVSPIITERILGFLTLLGIATLSLPFIDSPNSAFVILSHIVPIFFSGLLFCLAGIGTPFVYRFIHSSFQRWIHIKIVVKLLQIIEAVHLYLGHLILMMRVIALSLAGQLLQICIFWVFGLGLGVNTGFLQYVLVVPLILVAAGVPVSIGGFGVREASAIVLFTALGMDEGDAAVIALLFIPVLLAASLPGLYFFLTTKDHDQFVAEAEQTIV